jgi:hypothetical protein
MLQSASHLEHALRTAYILSGVDASSNEALSSAATAPEVSEALSYELESLQAVLGDRLRIVTNGVWEVNVHHHWPHIAKETPREVGIGVALGAVTSAI